jgi:hypothetical protein
MICSGVRKRPEAGGVVALVDFNNHQDMGLLEAPQTKQKDVILTRNAMTFEILQDRIRFYFVPEDNTSTLYIFDLK